MFFETLQTFTPEDTRAMAAHGVPYTRISEWKGKRGLPTRAQTLALARVKKLDFDSLEREIVLLELERESKKNSAYAEMLKLVKPLWRRTAKKMERAMGIEPTS